VPRDELGCPRCGGLRLIPLTFDEPLTIDGHVQPSETPERDLLDRKCLTCGLRFPREPSS
jgi:hypothetical protein